ncbi:MAG: hypothetical protein RL616_1993, partial [Verrucomicrobiota bacterium]
IRIVQDKFCHTEEQFVGIQKLSNEPR